MYTDMHDGGVFSMYLLCCVCADVGSDVTLENNLIRPLAGSPLVPVFFTLRVDGVSQEINETFSITLTLNPGTTTPGPADFSPTVTVCIIDQDGEFPNSPMIHY